MRESLLKSTLNALYFSGMQSISGFWTGGVGSILMLHHVREADRSHFAPNRHLQVTPGFLDNTLHMVKKHGFELVSLDEMHACYVEKKFNPYRKMIAITLDDGYRDNLQNAVPIFKQHKAPFTIFVAPGLVDGRARLWWEDLSAIIATRDEIKLSLPRGHQNFDISTLEKKHHVYHELSQWLTTKIDEEQQRKIVDELAWMYKIDAKAHGENQIMNWQEIYDLAKEPLCTIGAHTIHHYALARLNETQAQWEMRESAGIIKAELGKAPEHFAYPYGYKAAAGWREFLFAKQLGFKTAVTTRHGVLQKGHGDHLLALPRISLNGNFQSLRYVETLLSGLPTLLANKGRRINIG